MRRAALVSSLDVSLKKVVAILVQSWCIHSFLGSCGSWHAREKDEHHLYFYLQTIKHHPASDQWDDSLFRAGQTTESGASDFLVPVL